MKKLAICMVAFLYSVPLSAGDILRLRCTGTDNLGTDHQLDIEFDIEIHTQESTAKVISVFGFETPENDPALPAKITESNISWENKQDSVTIRYNIDRYSGQIEFTADYPLEKGKKEYGEGVCEKLENKRKF